jgi:predicted lipid-binding transport protein (Tim44 family)
MVGGVVGMVVEGSAVEGEMVGGLVGMEGEMVGAIVEGAAVGLVGMAVEGAMEGSAVVGCTVLTLVRTTITQRRRTKELNGACMAQIADHIRSNERVMRCSLLDLR